MMAAFASAARNAGMQPTYPPRAAVTAWILFDWAAQPYFTLITTFVFAPYFATHVASDPAQGQALWGFATAAAGLPAFTREKSACRIAPGPDPLWSSV